MDLKNRRWIKIVFYHVIIINYKVFTEYLFKSSFLSEIVNSVDSAFFNGGKGFDFSGPRDPLLGPAKLDLIFSDPSSDFEFSRDKFSKKAKLSFILIFSFFSIFRVDKKMAKKPYTITDSIEQSGLRGMINFS